MLDAIEHALENVDASAASKRAARAWLRTATGALEDDGHAPDGEQAAAGKALAKAAEHALGLAPQRGL